MWKVPLVLELECPGCRIPFKSGEAVLNRDLLGLLESLGEADMVTKKDADEMLKKELEAAKRQHEEKEKMIVEANLQKSLGSPLSAIHREHTKNKIPLSWGESTVFMVKNVGDHAHSTVWESSLTFGEKTYVGRGRRKDRSREMAAALACSANGLKFSSFTWDAGDEDLLKMTRVVVSREELH